MNPPVPGFDSKMQFLIDTMSDALLFATHEGDVVGANRAACVMFGYTLEEIVRLGRNDLADMSDPRVSNAVRDREQNGRTHAAMTMFRKGMVRFEAELTSVRVELEDQEDQLWILVRDLTDRHRAAEATAALSDSLEMLQALSDAAFEGVVIHQNGVIQSTNRAAEAMVGVAHGFLAGRKLMDFIAPDYRAAITARIAAGDDQPFDSLACRDDGSEFPVETQSRTLPVQVHGGPMRVVAVRDTTVRKQLEEQLRQSQKMEAVGRLAGGIAHDFNNLLSVILGSTSLASSELSPGHPALEELVEVRLAAERAIALTHQLLAFSRKQVLQTKVVNIPTVVRGTQMMISRVIGEDIALSVWCERDDLNVHADPSQIELMLLNLVVNARDAMPEGGRLLIEVRHVVLDEDFQRGESEGHPGEHVMLVVKDTGCGMSTETKQRIFEPFFTTKGPGRGTGLGLSTVFGIVKQSGGVVRVESTLGQGSTFRLYLPVTTEEVSETMPTQPYVAHVSQDKTILVVEDEAQLRRVVVVVLRRAGYTVIEAVGAADAVAISDHYDQNIDLLLTDMVMPQMNGKQLAEILVVKRPRMHVMYMSGYTEDNITEDLAQRNWHFLPKPLQADTLIATVRGIIG